MTEVSTHCYCPLATKIVAVCTVEGQTNPELVSQPTCYHRLYIKVYYIHGIYCNLQHSVRLQVTFFYCVSKYVIVNWAASTGEM